MDQLKGSLRCIPLPAVVQFIAGLGSTGRLKITQAAWTGEIALREGQVVGVQLGVERGKAALDGLVIALTEADFVFVDDAVDASDESLFTAADFARYVADLGAERDRLRPLTSGLSQTPRLVDQPLGGSDAGHVTMETSALQLLPMLLRGQTLEQLARQRGLARTLREVAALQAGGLVTLESPPVVKAPPPTTPRPTTPRVPTPSVRAVPSVTPQPVKPQRRGGWWQSPSSAGNTAKVVAAPTPTIAAVPDPTSAAVATPTITAAVAPSVAGVAEPTIAAVVQRPRPRLVTADEGRRFAEPTVTAQKRGWHKAVIGLFVRE